MFLTNNPRLKLDLFRPKMGMGYCLHITVYHKHTPVYSNVFEKILYVQELYLQGNSVGDEGVRALISGLSLRKGLLMGYH